MTSRRWHTLAAALLAFLVVNGVLSIRNKNLTYDEIVHYTYGTHILELDSRRFDDSKMPVSALNALPEKLASLLLPDSTFTAYVKTLQVGRFVTIMFSALLALLVAYWARALYGSTAGLLALFLYVFDPNITAHSQLITTDLYAALSITFAGYTFWRFARHRSWRNGLAFGTALGLAQIAKYTAVFLYALFPLLLLVHDGRCLLTLIQHRRRQTMLRYAKRGLLQAFAVAFMSLFIINVGFLFNRSFTPLAAYTFRSALFQAVQAKSAALPFIRIPVPYPYVEGLDWVTDRERTGAGYSRVYLLGQLQERGRGFVGYYFVAYLYKVPLAAQILTVAALMSLLRSASWRRFVHRELFLLGPIAFFLLYFNFFNKAQIGIRFILPIFPMSHVFAARLIHGWSAWTMRARVAVAVLAAYLVVSVLSYYPQYLAYFNELVPDRRMAYKVLADSNLDWGQNRLYLEQYLRVHPGVHVSPAHPVSGTIVVSVNELVGVGAKPETFQWLRDHFEPVSTIQYSYLVFDVTPEQLDALAR